MVHAARSRAAGRAASVSACTALGFLGAAVAAASAAAAAVADAAAAAGGGSGPADAAMAMRALGLADRIVTCTYSQATGLFVEDMWQSGNTIETLSNLMLLTGSTRWAALLNNSYDLTPVVVDNCFDDHQWWLLGWVRAYEASGNEQFILRAADVFDYVVANGWVETPCGGGVMWCPDSTPDARYMNAITNELFLTAAMELHPYTVLLGRPPGFYLAWAEREWAWFGSGGSPGMVGPGGLVNDGLSLVNGSCVNNNGTTWTYNQGVLLDGLAALSAAGGGAGAGALAGRIAGAAMTQLAPRGVLVEPCGSGGCDGDQQIFKGVFIRHLSRFAALEPGVAPAAAAFIVTNARSLLANASCGNGYFGTDWAAGCVDSRATVAGASSALDLLVAAAGVEGASSRGPWTPLGLGNCADAGGAAMPNCFDTPITALECAGNASATHGAVAYDWYADCLGSGFCRVRTLGGAAGCPAGGWQWSGGPATNVTSSNGESLTMCFVASS